MRSFTVVALILAALSSHIAGGDVPPPPPPSTPAAITLGRDPEDVRSLRIGDIVDLGSEDALVQRATITDSIPDSAITLASSHASAVTEVVAQNTFEEATRQWSLDVRLAAKYATVKTAAAFSKTFGSAMSRSKASVLIQTRATATDTLDSYSTYLDPAREAVHGKNLRNPALVVAVSKEVKATCELSTDVRSSEQKEDVSAALNIFARIGAGKVDASATYSSQQKALLASKAVELRLSNHGGNHDIFRALVPPALKQALNPDTPAKVSDADLGNIATIVAATTQFADSYNTKTGQPYQYLCLPIQGPFDITPREAEISRAVMVFGGLEDTLHLLKNIQKGDPDYGYLYPETKAKAIAAIERVQGLTDIARKYVQHLINSPDNAQQTDVMELQKAFLSSNSLDKETTDILLRKDAPTIWDLGILPRVELKVLWDETIDNRRYITDVANPNQNPELFGDGLYFACEVYGGSFSTIELRGEKENGELESLSWEKRDKWPIKTEPYGVRFQHFRAGRDEATKRFAGYLCASAASTMVSIKHGGKVVAILPLGPCPRGSLM